MERELYSIELIRLIKELNERCSGFFIEQFYEISSGTFRMKLSNSGKKINIVFKIPYYASELASFATREDATNYAIGARKRICGFKILRMSLYNNDRIIIIDIEKGELQRHIIFEMFGKGNMIITNGEMVAEMVYYSHDFSDRSVKPKSRYDAPKNNAIDPFDSQSVSKFISKIASSNGKLGAIISKNIAIGSRYVEQILNDSGIDPKMKTQEVNNELLAHIDESLHRAMTTLLFNGKVIVYEKDNVPIDLSLIPLGRYIGQNDVKSKEFDSIDKALSYIYSATLQNAEKAAEDPKVIALKESIMKQQANIESAIFESERAKAAGALILARANDINLIIGSVNSSKSATEKSITAPLGIRVISIDKKSKIIKIEIDEI